MKMNKLVKGLLVGFMLVFAVGCEEAKEVENIEVQDTNPDKIVMTVECESYENVIDDINDGMIHPDVVTQWEVHYNNCNYPHKPLHPPVGYEDTFKEEVIEGYIIDHKLSLGENIDLCLAGLSEDEEALFYEIVDYPIYCINNYTRFNTMQLTQKAMSDVYLDKCPLVYTNRLGKDEVKLALMKGFWHTIPHGNAEGDIQTLRDLYYTYEISVYSLYDDILETHNSPFTFPTKNLDEAIEKSALNFECVNCGKAHSENESYYNEDGMSACSEACFNAFTGQ